MADTTSTTQFKADISQLKSAMQAAQRQVKLASSEFKKATAGLDDWSSSAEGLQAKIKQLNSTLQAQKKQAELANKEFEKTVKVYGKNSAEADRAKMKLNGYETAVAKTEKELDKYEQELKDCENATGRFADETEDLESATQSASDGFTVMKGALANLVADGFRMAISAAKDFAAATLEAGMNFEQGMAQVQAISGASGEELEALTEKAKEMGAKTKFSATESAEAFNYMAMAGWKTEDMLNGIEGIMNLAAASGSDLATTSDIVTDALTAMGYSAGDAGRLADVMAAASSNANTNVEMMGQTFQYAAPIVGALGYNMEDTAVQIGLMANAGIKGEKAGTALRSILTRLSAPPKECAEAMEELGISLTDSEGNMKSLDDVMGDLRKAFQGLDETQQTANAKAIAGQEAMSGLLAIVNAAPADYEKLTKAVKESEGAASSMADTMNDTVEGQLTLLKSQIEGVQIQIYEKLTPALKDGIKKVSESISAINWDKVADKVGDFARKAIDLFAKIIENADEIIIIMKTVGTVLAATFVVTKILSFAQGITTLVSAFKAMKTATEAATASQLLLNAAQAATPIGLVTAAVAGLVAGIAYLVVKNNEAAQTTQILTDYEQEQIDKINEMAAAYEEMKAARDEQVEAINGEFAHYTELSSELDSLVDANGRVKEGYEDRANFILTTLNEACGTEMKLVDGVIENYQDEKKALDQLLQTKKAEAILRANEEAYTTAIQKQKEATNNLTTAQGIYAQNKAELAQAEKEYNKIMNMTAEEYAEQNDLMWDLGTASSQLKNEQEEMGKKFNEAKAAVGESRMAMVNAQTTYDEYMSTIKNYEGLSSAIISGDAKKIQTALTNMQNDFMTAETATKGSLQRQVQNYENNLANLKQAMANGTPSITQEMIKQAEAMVSAAKAELDKAPEDFASSANHTAQTYGDTLGSPENQENARSGATALKTAAKEELDDPSEFEESGNNYGDAFAVGITAQDILVGEAASGIASTANNSLNSGIDAHSPSRTAMTSGENFGQGFINGMNNKTNSIWSTAWNLAKTALNALKSGQKEGSPSKITYQSGVYFVQGYINGIVSQNKKLQSTVKGMVTTVVKELGKMSNYNFSDVAENASSMFAQAFSKKLDYSLSKLSYQNEQKLNIFDEAIEKYETQKSNDSSKLQANSDKVVKAYEKDRDKTIRSIEKQRDKQVKALEKERDSLIKGIEKSRDAQIKAQEKSRDAEIKSIEKSQQKSIKALEADRDAHIKTLEKSRDAKIKAIEKERDNTITNLQNQLDNLSYKKEDSARRKQLQKEIKSARENASKRIEAAKKVSQASIKEVTNHTAKEIKAVNDNAKKAIKNEKSVASENIKTLKKTASENLKELKSSSSKEIKAVKDNANQEIKNKKNASDKAIEKEKANTKKQIAASDKKYDALIANENKKKDAYSKASGQMITEYTNAMNEYQSKAQEVIDNTINGIIDKYDQRYDDLSEKQNSLVDKLKSAGDLFDISGAGVMTINDIQAQTKQIRDYTSKLQKIKNKVSSELFEQIASYDMKEGSAFMDRLLSMNAKDLEAYNKAYTEKMEAAQKAGESIYKADFNRIAKDYKTEINQAFNDLPTLLEEMGKEAMRGFLSGLTTNTDYMEDEIKLYVKAIVDTFKKDLKISSPSKVMMEIGDYTGEGLVNGLKSTINSVKKVAQEMAQSVATPIDGLKANIGEFKSAVNSNSPASVGTSTVINNYELQQNNYSPKSLTALETYQARRQQVAMVKAMT